MTRTGITDQKTILGQLKRAYITKSIHGPLIRMSVIGEDSDVKTVIEKTIGHTILMTRAVDETVTGLHHLLTHHGLVIQSLRIYDLLLPRVIPPERRHLLPPSAHHHHHHR